jgi:uncharacterized membrane protein YgcG
MVKFFLLLFTLIIPLSWASAVEDDANLLNQRTIKKIEQLGMQLQQEVGVQLLFKTEEQYAIKQFENDSRLAFARWIRQVPQARGVFLYIQVEQKTSKGRINISFGYGLKGGIDQAAMQSILNDKILLFCNDLSNQAALVDGIAQLVSKLREHFENNRHKLDHEEETSKQIFLTREKILWLLLVLFGSLGVTIVVFVFKKRTCPQCGARLHVNVRPMVRGDGRFRRIKIIKCLDCNYYKKYLF